MNEARYGCTGMDKTKPGNYYYYTIKIHKLSKVLTMNLMKNNVRKKDEIVYKNKTLYYN